MNQEFINTLRSSWPGKTLQDLVTLYHWLKKHNKTIEDVEQYLTDSRVGHRADLNRKRETILTTEKCPECRARLIHRPIKIPKGPANLYGHKWHKYCSNKQCLYEQYGVARK